MTTTKVGLTLSEPKQWDSWIYLIKSRAQQYKIWDLINLNLPTKPTTSSEPDLPDEDDDNFNQKMSLYNAKLKKYYKETQALADLTTTIQSSISSNLLPLIQNEPDSHPYTLLQALRTRIAPSDYATELHLEQRYHKLIQAGPKDRSLEGWLQELEEIYTKAKAKNLPEVSGNRPVRDFYLALDKHDTNYATMQLVSLDNSDSETDFFKVVEKYRKYARIKSLQSNNPKQAFTATLRGEKQPQQQPPQCLCGERMWYIKCPYLNKNARASTWTPDPKVQTQIQRKLRDPKIKQAVEAALERERTYQAKKDSADDSDDSDKGSICSF